MTDDANAHASAAPTREDIDAVWKVAARGDIAEIRTFIRSHRFAAYNAGRKSLQVVGCDGAVLTNIPLTEVQIAGIAE